MTTEPSQRSKVSDFSQGRKTGWSGKSSCHSREPTHNSTQICMALAGNRTLVRGERFTLYSVLCNISGGRMAEDWTWFNAFIAVAHLRQLSVYRLKTWPPAYNIYLLHSASWGRSSNNKPYYNTTLNLNNLSEKITLFDVTSDGAVFSQCLSTSPHWSLTSKFGILTNIF